MFWRFDEACARRGWGASLRLQFWVNKDHRAQGRLHRQPAPVNLYFTRRAFGCPSPCPSGIAAAVLSLPLDPWLGGAGSRWPACPRLRAGRGTAGVKKLRKQPQQPQLLASIRLCPPLQLGAIPRAKMCFQLANGGAIAEIGNRIGHRCRSPLFPCAGGSILRAAVREQIAICRPNPLFISDADSPLPIPSFFTAGVWSAASAPPPAPPRRRDPARPSAGRRSPPTPAPTAGTGARLCTRECGSCRSC